MSELTESLRYCATNNSCEYCPRHKYQYESVIACAEQMLNEAADTIENQNNLLDLNTQRCEALRGQLRDSHESYEKHLNEIESQVPRWIPVTERLPERADEVLIAYREEYDDWTGGYEVSTATYMPRAGRWDYDHLKITHWMPLPKAPDLT